MLLITIGALAVVVGMVPPRNETVVSIIQMVADASDTRVEALPPLTDIIDPDALDTIATSDLPGDVTVTFTYTGRDVLVRSGNTVYVKPVHGQSLTPSGMTQN